MPAGSSCYHVQLRDTFEQLPQSTASWYQEFLIENFSGNTLFILTPDGRQFEVPTRYSSQVVAGRVDIKFLYKQGNQSPNVGYTQQMAMTFSPKFPVSVITLEPPQLSRDAIYIRELGIAIATAENKERLCYVHQLNSKYLSLAMDALYNDILTDCAGVPCLVDINSHDGTKTVAYIGINGNLATVNIRHDLNAPEQTNITLMRCGKTIIARDVKFDLQRDKAVQIVLENTPWILGFDRAEVIKLLDSTNVLKGNFYTSEEVKSKVQSLTAEMEQKLSDAQKENELLKKELASLKKELSFTQLELEKANSDMKLSVDQQTQIIKLTQSLRDQEAARERNEQQKEQLRLKTESDTAIASTKIQKEELSLRGVEASNLSTFAKTASILLPIAASLGMWMSRQGATSSLCAMVGTGVSAATGPAVLVGVGGIGAISLLTYSANKIWSVAKKFWNRLWE